MDSIPAPETQPSECDACVAYECQVSFPAEFQGKYFAWNSYKQTDGALCILHYRDATKDAAKCAAAVERKIQAADFNFRGVLFCGDFQFPVQIDNANFSRARFTGKAIFSVATFSGAANFIGAKFSGEANFFTATFSGEARFSKAKFSDNANFSGATFSGKANFFRATFNGGAYFDGATFNGAADFLSATFSGPANLVRATFNAAAYFFSATFSAAADFRGATFKEMALFADLAKEKNKQGERTSDKVDLDFSGVAFDQPEKILFRNVNLSVASFLHADVRDVRFTTNVNWLPGLRDVREADKEDYPHVEVLCRQLRQNYEEGNNYPDAGLFYQGEMEMRRKQMPAWRRDLFSLPALYHASSGYGQDPVRAFWMTVLLMLLFTLCHTWAGLKLESGVQGHFPNNISWAVKSVGEWFSNFMYGGLHTLQVLTFSRNRTFAPLNWKGELLIVLQTIILPLQIALFALAVRRKFQR